MSYFAPYTDETGLHLPTYRDRLDALCEAYGSIFSPDAALTPASPDYQLLSVFARALDDVSALLLSVYNARNPFYAQGRSLDLLAALYGLTRRGATCSRAELSLTGSRGTVIPSGSSVSDTAGYLWETEEAVTLDASGSGSVFASCQTPGEVYAAAGEIASIVTPVTGWTGVTNPEASTIGRPEESDASLRGRLAGALPSASRGSGDAVTAALLSVPGCRAVSVCVNDGGETDDRGIPAHSIAPVILGGGAGDIARAIYDAKPPGIATWGSAAAPYTPPGGSPATLYFSRPTAVKVSLTLQVISLSPDFSLSAFQEAVAPALVSFLEQLPIGAPLSLSRLIAVCYGAVPDMAAKFCFRSLQASIRGQAVTDTYTASWREWLYTTAGDIQVVSV